MKAKDLTNTSNKNLLITNPLAGHLIFIAEINRVELYPEQKGKRTV